MNQPTPTKTPTTQRLLEHLDYLKLAFIREHHETLATEAVNGHWTPVDYLAGLAQGEALLRQQRTIQRRIRLARFPVIKTLEPFQWSWPKQINRAQIQNLFRLQFIEHKANVIFLGGVGLGKTHLATALGYAACLKGHSVLFASAIDVINTLAAAQNAGRLKQALAKYLKPSVLVLDELGYLPIDKTGADLLFQIISQRYEHGSLIASVTWNTSAIRK